MKKIPTIFIRDEENRKLVTREINPVCKWVFDDEGVATRKYDGACCCIKDGKLFKRRELKKGQIFPEEFEPVETDPITGKTVGWMPVTDSPEDKWFVEAYKIHGHSNHDGDGTYELLGPKIQGNPEHCLGHYLFPHDKAENLQLENRSFDGIKDFLSSRDIEGIVFHHDDGRMAKIKKRDFGLKR